MFVLVQCQATTQCISQSALGLFIVGTASACDRPLSVCRWEEREAHKSCLQLLLLLLLAVTKQNKADRYGTRALPSLPLLVVVVVVVSIHSIDTSYIIIVVPISRLVVVEAALVVATLAFPAQSWSDKSTT